MFTRGKMEMDERNQESFHFTSYSGRSIAVSSLQKNYNHVTLHSQNVRPLRVVAGGMRAVCRVTLDCIGCYRRALHQR